MPTSREELEQAVERKRLEQAVIAKRSQSPASTPAKDEIDPINAGIIGAAQGATMGFSDEIIGGAKALAGKVSGEGNLIPLYEKYRDERRAIQDKAAADSPTAYRLGDISGTIASALLPGTKLLAPVSEASTLANAGRAAVGGAISGAGYSDAKNLADLMADTAVGGAIGGTIGAIVDKGSKVLESLKPSNLNKSANERAVKAAIGRNQRLFEELSNVRAPDTGEVALESAGRRLRESGIMGPLSSAEDMKAGVTKAAQEAGQKISLTLKTLDDAIPQAVSGTKISEDLLSIASSLPDSEVSKAQVQKLLGEAEQFEKMGNIDFATAQKYKELWAFDPKLSDHASLGRKLMNKVNRVISNNMDEAADQIASAAGEGTPLQILADTYKQNRGDYQAFKSLEKGISKNIPRNISNRFASPTDYLTGVAVLGYGLTQGDSPSLSGAAPYALAAATLNHQIRLRGNSLASVTAGKLADILIKAPEALGRFSSTLLKAAEISPNALWVTHQLLLKDPEYLKTIGKDKNEAQGDR